MNKNECMKDKIFYILIDMAPKLGLSNISLNDIANAVGIKKPSLYNYWTGRDELIHEFFLFWNEQLHTLIKQKLAKQIPENLSDYSTASILRLYSNEATSLFTTYPINNLFMIVDSEKYILDDAADLAIYMQQILFKNTSKLFELLIDLKKLEISDINSATALYSCCLMEKIRYLFYSENVELKIEAKKGFILADQLLEHFITLYAPTQK